MVTLTDDDDVVVNLDLFLHEVDWVSLIGSDEDEDSGKWSSYNSNAFDTTIISSSCSCVEDISKSTKDFFSYNIKIFVANCTTQWING